MNLGEVANIGCLDLMSVGSGCKDSPDHSWLGSDVYLTAGVLAELLLPNECLGQGQSKISPISWVGKEDQLSRAENFVPDQFRTLL